jgi:hypothetical protein
MIHSPYVVLPLKDPKKAVNAIRAMVLKANL